MLLHCYIRTPFILVIYLTILILCEILRGNGFREREFYEDGFYRLIRFISFTFCKHYTKFIADTMKLKLQPEYLSKYVH